MYLIKWLIRLLFWLVILSLLGWGLFKGFLWLRSAEAIELRSGEETRSTVHWLQTDTPLVFTFSPERTFALRILSNAIFEEQIQMDRPVHYAIEYTLLDEKLTPISKHVYHHASKLALDSDQEQVKQIIENRVALAVASGQSFYISNEQLTNVTAVGLKLIPEENHLKGVVVRIHAKNPVNVADKNSVWLKQPLDWRERMVNYHTIGENSLSQLEVDNAVTFEWQKLAPQGIPQIDFISDVLYEVLPYHVLSYDFGAEQLNLDGFYTDHTLSASFRVYENRPLYIYSEQPLDDLSVMWHDLRHFHAPTQVFLEPTEEEHLYILKSIEPGLVVLHSNTPIQTQWYREDMSRITALHSYYYNLDATNSAHYKVTDDSDLNFEFRGPEGSQADISIFDANNQLLDSYKFYLKGEHSFYDRVINAGTERGLTTKAEKFFLRLKKGAAYIVIASPDKVQTKLQARRQEFHYQAQQCEQLCKVELENFYEIGAWYSQKAENDFSFTEQQMITNIRLFEEPETPEQSDTQYQSRNLFSVLPRSNTVLLDRPERYFEDKQVTEPKVHEFNRVYRLGQLDIKRKPELQSGARVIVKSDTAPFYQELDLAKLSEADKLALLDTDKQLYANLGHHRPWAKQRLYYLKREQPLTLHFTHRPLSVAIRPYLTHKREAPIILRTHLSADYRAGLTDKYTIENKRLALFEGKLTEAFMLHPAIDKVYTYPGVTVAINPDVEKLHSLTVTAEQDVWISVSDELPTKTQKTNWWLYESF